MRSIVQIAVLTGTLVVGRVPVTLAQQSDAVPVATGVVATITSLDSRTGLATLTTTAGEGFQVPKEGSWKGGDKVACDRLDDARPPLQDCQPWP